MDVEYLPEIIDELKKLIDILYEKEYFSFKESAHRYIDDLIDYAENNIPKIPAITAPDYFKRYASYYIIYQPNKKTSWYIFFDKKDHRYLITYITNNHVKGQHIR